MAHYICKVFAVAALVAGFTNLTNTSPASSQSMYRSGNARIYQGSGLAGVSSSYITGGTMSRSAQAGAGLYCGSSTSGITAGSSGNTGLPTVRLGSTVGTAGDYMRSDLNPNFSYTQQPRQGQRQGRRNYQQQQQQQQQQFNGVASYGSASAYSRNSMPTGRQATQVQTTIPAASSGGGEFKGY